ncbi:MAG: hypothetical protein GX594_01620 [Pirellulaceae bacterium]|nr:hypothetical protein [Pirellulaceae bacterium]
MRKIFGAAFGCVLIAISLGCGKQSQNGQAAGNKPGANPAQNAAAQSNKLTGPAAAVHEFLEAVRTGNDDQAAQMLSTIAREKTAALNRNVTPPASDTAKFTIGKVKFVGEDGAQVESSWTDLDMDGEPRTDDAVWVLRKEAAGWRIAGVAVIIFPGEPPLLLNFEDPEDMFRKQQWVREEIRRRMNDEMTELQAQGEKNSENPIRR